MMMVEMLIIDDSDGNVERQDDNGDTNNDGGDVDDNYSDYEGSIDGEGHCGSNDEVNEVVNGGDGDSIVDCDDDADGDSGDKNNWSWC